MGILPVYISNDRSSTDKREKLFARRDQPLLQERFEEGRIPQRQDPDSLRLDKIVLHSRIIIIEGISGSGKDTFQTYLRNKLSDRDVYDYSEGELLQSWKQLHIDGIFELRVKFMKLFVNYVKDIVSRDENAVFVLNRFHLSTYVSTIIRQPTLQSEYDEIINVLRMLPIHVFILQLDENEINERSLHPERTTAWQKHQKQIVNKEGFRDTLGRHVWQQGLILEAAERQQIPYSVLRFPSTREIATDRVRVSKTQSIIRRGERMNAGDEKISRRKRELPQSVHG